MRILELGTHKTVCVDTETGRRRVIRHNPPRDVREVLENYREMVERRQRGRGEDCEIPGVTNGETPPLPVAPRKEVRSRLLPAAEAANVLNNPLVHLPGAATGTALGIRVCTAPADGVSDPSLGQYTDFRMRRRTLPQLNEASVAGILRQPGALDGGELDEAKLRTIAAGATAHRCSQGFPGFAIGAESAELYIRIFRALGLTEENTRVLSAAELNRMYVAYLAVHAS